jgi:hypothetical protein
VTDTGGVDDKSFNQTAWKGVQDAPAEQILGVEGKASQGWARIARGRDRLRAEHQLVHRRRVRHHHHRRLPARRRHAEGGRGQPGHEVLDRRLRLRPGHPERARPGVRHRRGGVPRRLSRRRRLEVRHPRHLRRHQHPAGDHLHGRLRTRRRLLQRREGHRASGARLGSRRPERACSPTTSSPISTTAARSPRTCSTKAPTSSCRSPDRSASARRRSPRARRRQLKIIGVDADQYLTDPEQEARLPDLDHEEHGHDRGRGDQAGEDGTFEGGVIVGTLASGGVGWRRSTTSIRTRVRRVEGELEAIRQGIIDGSISVGG